MFTRQERSEHRWSLRWLSLGVMFLVVCQVLHVAGCSRF